MFSLEDIREALERWHPEQEAPGCRFRAAVALILRENGEGAEILFIERARRHGDPWSGHLAFPGGRIEPRDRGLREAAERETLEEIGLDLQRARFLGSLGDLGGDRLPVVVSCFVYGVDGDERLRLNEEVADAFWVPLEHLLDPRRHVTAPYLFDGERAHHPAIRLLGPGRPLLWGITYRLVGRFFQALGCDFPPGEVPASGDGGTAERAGRSSADGAEP